MNDGQSVASGDRHRTEIGFTIVIFIDSGIQVDDT